MALAKKQSRSSSIIIMAIIALVLGVIGYFVYVRFLAGDSTNGNNNSGLGSRGGLVNFNSAILNDSRVTNLQDYERSTNVDANRAGQVEPFR